MKRPNWLAQFIKRQNEGLDVDFIDVPLPALPEPLEGFRIISLSDLHLQSLTSYHREIVKAVEGTEPSLIAILGDTMDNRTDDPKRLTPLFIELSRIATTVAILGNNDCLPGLIDALRTMYRDGGVTLLENETRMMAFPGGALQISGMMDPAAERRGILPPHAMVEPEEREAQQHVSLSESLPPKEKEGAKWPSILLVHQPQIAKQYAPLHPSLILAGHAHGGQIRVPGIGGLYAPDQGVFPRYTSGLYTVGDAKLLVNRGLGNHEFPLRVNNRPHLPVAVLRRA